MCNKYNTAEGCKFGDKCIFAHGEEEIKGKSILPSCDQVSNASTMLVRMGVNVARAAAHPSSNVKSRLCNHFIRGNCTYGDRCHFAHGVSELRKVHWVLIAINAANETVYYMDPLPTSYRNVSRNGKRSIINNAVILYRTRKKKASVVVKL